MPGPGRPFLPGMIPNPEGRRREDPNMKAMRKLTREEVADIASLILTGTVEDLKEVATNPDASILKVWFASVAMKAIQKGDPTAIEILLARIIGKPDMKIEVSNSNASLTSLSEEELKAKAKELTDRLKSHGAG